MNRPKTLIGLAFFFGVMIFIMDAIGASIASDDHPYIREAATGSSDDYNVLNQSYAHLWDSEMERMGINKYHPGEYGMSDRIWFEDVYHSTKSYGDKYASSWSDTIVGKINSFLKGDGWPSGDLDWDHGHTKTIHEGEHIYIYPHLNIDLPGGNNPFELDLKQYIFVRTFDAYSGGNEWLHDPDTKDVSGGGDKIEWIPQLNCGIMGEYDLYYVIDVAYFNQDILGSIPGINLLSDMELADMIKEDKALFMERYGGVIYGDLHQSTPDMLAYHELQYSQSGGINVFFDHIRKIQMGWSAFTTTDNSVVNTGFTMIMGIFSLIFALTIYYEIKSYIPFVSGGDGGD